MEKIDLKDKKILYHLDLNSMESFRSIDKKKDLSKDIIISCVKKLQEKRIIQSFNVHFNHFLHDFMDDISKNFPKTIKKYINYTIERNHKFFILK